MAQLKDLLVSGAARFLNGLNVNGDLTIAGNLLPAKNETYNLGDSSHRWRQMQTKYLSVGAGDISSSGYEAVISGDFHTTGYSLFDDYVQVGGARDNSAYKFYVNGKIHLKGDTRITGNLLMTTGSSSIYWDDGTYRQRILTTDDATANTAVFNFQQSENTGSSWKDLLTIRDNGYLVLTPNTGGIHKRYTAAANDPMIQAHCGDIDSIIMRVNGYQDEDQRYGYVLKYIGAGFGEGNSLDLIADNMTNTDITAISVSNNGKVGIGSKYNTNYRLYVNGSSYLDGNNFLYGDISALYDSIDQYLKYTLEGTVANHAAKLSLYRITASGTTKTPGSQIRGILLDASTGFIELNAAASNPSTTAGARIAFRYDGGQPVYLAYTPNDTYRAPYGLKIWGSDGSASGAWLEVEGNLYIGSASNSNSNNNAALYIRNMSAIEGYDSWLRLNDNSSFSSGTYSPKLIRSDEALQVGNNGSKFYASSNGNGYFSNTLGIAGTNTNYKLYVNGTSYFNGNVYLPNNKTIYQNQSDTSNYTTVVTWLKNSTTQKDANGNVYTYQPQIGQHNTGGTNSLGSICILPYATQTDPWSGFVGLFITKNKLMLDNCRIPTTGNTSGTVGSTSQPVYINGGVITAITGTLANSINGNANRAQLLRNYYVDTAGNANSANRPTSANLTTTGSGGLITFKATSSMTTAKPPSDAHILHMFWDNTGGYDAQIAVQTSTATIYSRGCNAGTWNAWKAILDSNNYTSYTVTKTGGGANGTWSISITGNAATATKLATARTITIGAASKTFDGTSNISYTPYEMKLVRALYDTDSNLNAFANRGHALGMCNLGDNGSVDNPGGKTGWHHVINLTWRDTSDNNGSTTNEWCTQIANACGSSDLYVRSRRGGSITDGTAWTAPWTKILTVANYTEVLDSRYVNATGDTITGELYVDGGTTLASLLVKGDARFVNTIQGSISGNAGSATKWATAKAFYIADAEAKHTSSPSVNIDGSQSSYTLKLPSTIKATLEGNAASATYTTQLLGVNSSNTPYGASEGNLIRAVWDVKGDNRWYLKAGSYNCRVNYADDADFATNAGYLNNVSGHGVTITTSEWTNNPWGVTNLTRVWGQSGKKSSLSGDSADLTLCYGTHSSSGGAGWYMSIDGGIYCLHGIYGAVWNDYAEFRESTDEQPGRVVMEDHYGICQRSSSRLQPFAGVISDTFGFSEGKTDKAKTPLAVAGRVLVYPYQDRNNYKPGDCVCAAPNGTVDIMTREEVREYPDRIVGTVSEIPVYEEWGTGKVKVNGRIWIKIK